MKPLNAGRLKDKIKFYRRSNTRTSSGDLNPSYSPILTTFAEVLEKSGSYSVETGKINSEARVKITIRYRPDIFILPSDKVEWRGFEWIVENSPVVDPWRTSIQFEAVLNIKTSNRTTA